MNRHNFRLRLEALEIRVAQISATEQSVDDRALRALTLTQLRGLISAYGAAREFSAMTTLRPGGCSAPN